MFESIRQLKPYFFSLREIENNVSLDIKLPFSWKYDDIIKPYSSVKTKVQDKNEKYNLLSLVSSATQEGYDVVLACALEIINVNKDEEEKRKLFQLKVKELEELFKNESLEKLKYINLLEDYGQDNTTGDEMVGTGIEEGRIGDTDGEDEND